MCYYSVLTQERVIDGVDNRDGWVDGVYVLGHEKGI